MCAWETLPEPGLPASIKALDGLMRVPHSTLPDTLVHIAEVRSIRLPVYESQCMPIMMWKPAYSMCDL